MKNVTHIFRQGDSEILILSDISFVFQAKTQYAIMGPSGCGKSTLLFLLAGLLQPTRGAVFCNELSFSQQAFSEYVTDFRNKNFGVILQQPCLLPELSVIENVALKGELVGVALRVAQQKARELLKLVGLALYEKASVYSLSTGQQQRVVLARALMNDPHYLLADEPTGSLDAKNRDTVMALLQACATKVGATLIVVTHDQQVAGGMDEILCLDGGVLRVEHKRNKER